jgi:dihydropteroate synthase
MTRLGGEAALPDPAWEPDGAADALLAGTLSQYDDLLRALSVGAPELRQVGDAINSALKRDASTPRTLRLRDGELALDHTLVMGILNVTPDSFTDGGRYFDPAAALERAEQLEAQGADLIDVGGVSSRPGAEDVTLEEELRRLEPVLEQLADRVDVPFSIDTTRAEVARSAIERGAAMVNDVSGLEADPEMPAVVAETGAACVVMHSRGTPRTMINLTEYSDLVSEVYRYLAARTAWARSKGITSDRLLIDPGIGFAKTASQNLVLLRRLGEFRSLGLPVLVGASKKSFIGAVLGANDDARLTGTLATVAWAAFQGARVVRVHDVKPAVDVVRMADAILAADEEG